MLGKFAAIIGPLLLGGVTLITGSNRLGILSIIILFIAGGILLSKVREEEGAAGIEAFRQSVTAKELKSMEIE